MFGTRSVSLPKPSASAECHNLTFGPSLQSTSKHHISFTVHMSLNQARSINQTNLYLQGTILNVLKQNGAVHYFTTITIFIILSLTLYLRFTTANVKLSAGQHFS